MAGINEKLLKTLDSWLEARRAKVIVGGMFSAEFELINMLFQGTVLGPILWDLFFEDACLPIQGADFKEVAFANDLTGYKNDSKTTETSTALQDAVQCQQLLHAWGEANQTSFD